MACGDGDEWCPKCRVYGWHQPGNDCPEFERQERERGWLARQIEDARKSREARPQWMKNMEQEGMSHEK